MAESRRGEALRDARLARGWSRSEAAGEADVRVDVLIAFEEDPARIDLRDGRARDQLERLALAYGLSFGDPMVQAGAIPAALDRPIGIIVRTDVADGRREDVMREKEKVAGLGVAMTSVGDLVVVERSRRGG